MILISFTGIAQKELDIRVPFNSESDKYEYQEVIELNRPDSSLYSNAIKWIKTEFGNKEFEINERNKKIAKEFSFEISHTIKAGMGIKMPTKYTILSDLILEFKAGRYRYTLTNFKISQNENATTPESTLETFVETYNDMGIGKRRLGKTIEEICLEIDKEANVWIEKMKLGLANDYKTDDDW